MWNSSACPDLALWAASKVGALVLVQFNHGFV